MCKLIYEKKRMNFMLPEYSENQLRQIKRQLGLTMSESLRRAIDDLFKILIK